MENRIAIAETVQEIIGGNVWAKGNAVRIYLRKGFVAVEKEDGSVNIDGVGGNLFEDIKDSLAGAGFVTYRA